MRRYVLTLAAIAILLFVPHIAKADITYFIQNYPADQNGATLSGSIVTDGTIGSLAAGDILSWSWTITPSGGAPITLSSSAPGTQVFIEGAVVASQSSITIAGSSFNAFALYLPVNSGRPDLEYDRGPSPPNNVYSGLGPVGDIWQKTSPAMGGTEPWVIAETANAVPEPSSVLLFAMGGLVGIAIQRSRCR